MLICVVIICCTYLTGWLWGRKGSCVMEVLSKLWSGTHMLLFPLEMSEATGRHWCHLQVRGLRILIMSIEGSRIEEDMALWWPGKTGFSCNQVHKLWHHLDLGDIWRTGEKSIFRRRIWRKDSVKRSLHPGSLIGIESGDKDFHRRSGEVVEAWSLANTVPLARTSLPAPAVCAPMILIPAHIVDQTWIRGLSKGDLL